MNVSNVKNWKTAFLLSIIIPTGLLVTFRLSGIIREPLVIAETVDLPSKEWIFQRPYPERDIDLVQDLNTNYNHSEINVSMTLEIFSFGVARMTIIPPGDWLRFGLFLNATTKNGCYVRSIEIMFRNDTQPSYVWILPSFDLANLMVTSSRNIYPLDDFDKARLALAGAIGATEVSFKYICEWFLHDVSPQAENHSLELVCEIVYHNGTSYKKIAQHFFLSILKSEQP